MTNFQIFCLFSILMLKISVESTSRAFLPPINDYDDKNNINNQENFYNLKKINKVKSKDEKWPSNDFNITTILNSQIKLPCYIEKGRKFIWMQATRDEILSIDNNLITNDLKFSVELTKKCSNSHPKKNKEYNLTNESTKSAKYSRFNNLTNYKEHYSNNNKRYGCWSNLVINKVDLNDEGLYICQIDTMISSKIYLNILGNFRFYNFFLY
jgi:hypothetical protein